ncbi:Imm32 family immunity protein [Pseudomonas sp. CGJS7]|uniref:Imm32 family immunity protein n=1 Tax=Pseudomonas sp. CGJS7 TaxID=3109348 RepID=UPI003008CCBE
MQLFGYSDDGAAIGPPGPLRLREVTLAARPEELRQIAAFLAEAAEAMERMGDGYGHQHLCDHRPGFEDAPQLIVFDADGLTEPRLKDEPAGG